MGARAAGFAPDRTAQEDGAGPAKGRSRSLSLAPPALAAQVGSADVIVHGPGDLGLQSESTIAANADGSILVAGYNDARGFSVTPLSLSGIARSTDGGATWNEVPVGPGGAGVLPGIASGQVYGDPDVRYDPTRDLFVYSSIFVRPSDGLQGLSLHYSNSGASAGSAWTGPVEVTPAFVAATAADKEFIDVNPVTGRILVTWTSFGAGVVKILSSYSDDLGATWSTAAQLTATGAGIASVQASSPRFLPGTNNSDSNAYVVWRTSPASNTRNIGCARSTDGGATWSSAVNIDSSSFGPEDQILGVDRINTSPSMAIDPSTGRVYVVYMRTDSVGTGDIALRSFIGDCASAAPVMLGSNPGADRAQFYPWVTVDGSSGRVHVLWYDQDIDTSGDRTELMHTYSTDQGATWSPPTPLFDRPFHAGHGNDTSQPNLGDYLQATAQDGLLHSVAASVDPHPRFDEGQPSSGSMIGPDTYYDQLADATAVTPLRIVTVSAVESGCLSGANGFLDPGETVAITLTLENYVANATVGATTVGSIAGTLSTTTSGVTVTGANAAFPTLSAATTGANTTPFTISLANDFVAGTPVELTLALSSDQGSIELPVELATGTPGTPVTLINQDFETAVVPALPAGWSAVHGAGTVTVLWATSDTFWGGGNKTAYHSENSATRWERLLSPVVVVPTPSSGVQSEILLDMDLLYDLEEEPSQSVLAYDGMFLRITDQTGGSLLRSVLAEAFARSFLTGSQNHYPRHLPRSSNNSYFEDMSAWSGSSGGPVHVAMRFAGDGMTGRSIQLRFEYTQDSSGVCTDVGAGRGPCGVAIDNVVLKYVEVTSNACLMPLIFADGFERHDTSAWSLTVP